MKVDGVIEFLSTISGIMDTVPLSSLESRLADDVEKYVKLSRRRLYATAAKALATDPSIPDGERIAGALVQMCGDAKPYEVEE